jgi:hypothetical protein
MALDQDQIDELKTCFPNLAAVEDGEQTFILISSLPLPSGCDPQQVDGLLCPFRRDNYRSRLFLSARISHKGPGQNWNANGVIIAGRQWWAVSWDTKTDKQRLLAMIMSHLQAFECK